MKLVFASLRTVVYKCFLTVTLDELRFTRYQNNTAMFNLSSCSYMLAPYPCRIVLKRSFKDKGNIVYLWKWNKKIFSDFYDKYFVVHIGVEFCSYVNIYFYISNCKGGKEISKSCETYLVHAFLPFLILTRNFANSSFWNIKILIRIQGVQNIMVWIDFPSLRTVFIVGGISSFVTSLQVLVR